MQAMEESMTGREESHAAEHDSRRLTMSIRPRAAHCMTGEGIMYLLLDLDHSCRKSQVEREGKERSPVSISFGSQEEQEHRSLARAQIETLEFMIIPSLLSGPLLH